MDDDRLLLLTDTERRRGASEGGHRAADQHPRWPAAGCGGTCCCCLSLQTSPTHTRSNSIWDHTPYSIQLPLLPRLAGAAAAHSPTARPSTEETPSPRTEGRCKRTSWPLLFWPVMLRMPVPSLLTCTTLTCGFERAVVLAEVRAAEGDSGAAGAAALHCCCSSNADQAGAAPGWHARSAAPHTAAAGPFILGNACTTQRQTHHLVAAHGAQHHHVLQRLDQLLQEGGAHSLVDQVLCALWEGQMGRKGMSEQQGQHRQAGLRREAAKQLCANRPAACHPPPSHGRSWYGHHSGSLCAAARARKAARVRT